MPITSALPLRGSDRAIPRLGFGVYLVPPGATEEACSLALARGYRHIDTAAAYGNEEGVGAAVRGSGLSRDEIFVTTKCANGDHGYDEARRACHASLERLDVGAIDLYLIHWPVPSRDRYVDTWRAFIELQQEGLVRAIGVSNFEPEHIRRLIDETGVTPAANQVELHPLLAQPVLRRVHEELGIVTESWAPLGRGLVFDDPVIVEIAAAHRRTPAQVLIRWQLQLDIVVLTKSVTPARIEENLDVVGFELSPSEMAAIAALDRDGRTGPHPNEFVGP
jgi:diketogulonate reductase-like aldo/keto reductase